MFNAKKIGFLIDTLPTADTEEAQVSLPIATRMQALKSL